MPKVLLTYDLSEKPGLHTEVKDAMISKGYDKQWIDNKTRIIHEMPNTTIGHMDKTPAQAIADLKATASSIGARLEMVVAVEFTGFEAEWVNPRG
ncbi:MAG: hypothetical protein EOO61_04025 [Hymenobacter sp.]|nr:MAG: hypothetical protein EOO61_04025 [Hymenobacter sp.]